MKAITRLLRRLVSEEQGGEVLEYAIVAGLIIVGALATIGLVGTRVLTIWQGLNTGMQ